MSDNWVVQNLQNALDTWNAKITEIWSLVLTSPKDFKGGGIWTAIENVNSAVQAIGLALLVLFFVIGVVKTCGSFAEVKKPEHAVKLFVRFILAKAVITNGAADRMQIHDTVSVPTYGFKRKKTATATAQAHTEKMICRSDRPKNTASV